ncbi:hypothetical protein SAMN05444159_0681 [Bradyrhizobium lablabi]|uniref:Uncharacterized protein n=1 Tax=Bradyrhizobium lablabi TaxID=722472 RepID=A0A1M6JHJ8_9BRAD|nr:hypothetical protein [Bradyrhizobium lablabi]SHJ46208.1 hypothetical protein SAMN05444159_0681 [Bradyrhizobium lablabi]
MSWDERFAEPIVLDDGTTKLATLREAIAHLAKIIPKAERNLPEILTASDILTKAARSSSRASRPSRHFNGTEKTWSDGL